MSKQPEENSQPEAVVLIDWLETSPNTRDKRAATELRRLHEVNQELLAVLQEIVDWTDRYTTQGHPISVVARRAIAKSTGELE